MPLETSGVVTAKELPCYMQTDPKNRPYSSSKEKVLNNILKVTKRYVTKRIQFHFYFNPVKIKCCYSTGKAKTRGTMILYGLEMWSVTLREEHNIQVFDNSPQEEIF
jgi:UDP-glucose 4-epimerase